MRYRKKHSNFRYIIVFAATLIAAMMAFGSSSALAQGGGSSAPAKGGEHDPTGGGGVGDLGANGEGVDGGPIFIRLDSLLAPIIEKRRVKGYAEILLTLEVRDRDGMAEIYKKLVPLRDEFLRDLQFQAGMRGPGDPPINLKRIKARFVTLANRVVGEGVVVAVLVQSAFYNGT